MVDWGASFKLWMIFCSSENTVLVRLRVRAVAASTQTRYGMLEVTLVGIRWNKIGNEPLHRTHLAAHTLQLLRTFTPLWSLNMSSGSTATIRPLAAPARTIASLSSWVPLTLLRGGRAGHSDAGSRQAAGSATRTWSSSGRSGKTGCTAACPISGHTGMTWLATSSSKAMMGSPA